MAIWSRRIDAQRPGERQIQAAQLASAGYVYAFLNRRRKQVKLLWWDGDELALWYKHLEVGTFHLPAFSPQAKGIALEPTGLNLILGGRIPKGNPVGSLTGTSVL